MPVLCRTAHPEARAAAGSGLGERLADARQGGSDQLAERAGAVIRDAEPRSGTLLRRLAEIARRRSEPGAGGPERSEELFPASGRIPIGIEEILPGGELESPLGRVFLHERFRSAIERAPGRWTKPKRGQRARVRPGPGWMWEADPDP